MLRSSMPGESPAIGSNDPPMTADLITRTKIINTKITIAAAALSALLFSTGVFAQSSEEFPASQPVSGLWNQALPGVGSEGAPISANSLPPGFEVDTQQFTDQQVLNRYFQSQADSRLAALRISQPHV